MSHLGPEPVSARADLGPEPESAGPGSCVIQCSREIDGSFQVRCFQPDRSWVATCLSFMNLPDAVMVRYHKLSTMDIPAIGSTIVMMGPQKGESGRRYGPFGLGIYAFIPCFPIMEDVQQLLSRFLFEAWLVLRFLFRNYYFNMGGEIVTDNVEREDGLPNFVDGCKVYGDNYNLEANLIVFVLDLSLSCRDEPRFELKDFSLSLVIITWWTSMLDLICSCRS